MIRILRSEIRDYRVETRGVSEKFGRRRRRKTDWRRGWDSNPRDPFGPNGFQDRRFQPLTHPSDEESAVPAIVQHTLLQ